VALDTGSKTAYIGKPDAESLSKILSLRLDAKSLIPLIVGRLPEEIYTALQDPTKSELRLDLTSKVLRANIQDYKYFLEFDADTLLLKTFQAQDLYHSKLSLQLSYADYKDFAGVKIPSALVLEMPKDQTKIELRLSAPTLNQKLEERFFDLKVPEGYQSKKL
jgi:hypothetical protein